MILNFIQSQTNLKLFQVKLLGVFVILFILPLYGISQYITDTTWTVHGNSNCISPTDSNHFNFKSAVTGINMYSNRLAPDSTYQVVISGQAYISSGGPFNGVILSFSSKESGIKKTNTIYASSNDTIIFKQIDNDNHTYFNAFLFDPGNVDNNYGYYSIQLKMISTAGNEQTNILFSDNFDDGDYTNNPTWIDSSNGTGHLDVKLINGNYKFMVKRIGYDWGLAVSDVQIGNKDFRLEYTVEGISGDIYDRGIVYLLDDSGKESIKFEPDNWKDTLYIKTREYDESGNLTNTTVIAKAPYDGNDDEHTYQLVKKGNTYTAFEDGVEMCSGEYNNDDQWHDNITKVKICGRGSGSGSGVYYDDIQIYELVPTFIEDVKTESVPLSIHLYQNVPNPFNPTTKIEYTLDKTEHIQLAVYNILGKKIKTLYSGYQSSGTHRVLWDGRDASGKKVASGIYIYQLRTERQIINKRMTYLK